MTTYARSLNNLDLTDKSGIKNLIINGDFKLDQRNIGTLNQTILPTDTFKTNSYQAIGDIKVTGCSLNTSNVLTWVGSGTNPLTSIVAGTVIFISGAGWAGKVKTNNNGTLTLDSATPIVNANKTNLTISTRRFIVKHICDGVNVSYFQGMVPGQFKFNLEKQEFSSEDWLSSDLIEELSVNSANRLKVEITEPVTGYIFNDNSYNPVADLNLQFHCYDIYSKIVGKTVTLSFWYKSNLNAPYQICAMTKLNSGTTNETGDKMYQLHSTKYFPLTDRWTRFTHTFTVPAYSVGTDNNEFVVAEILIPSVVGEYYITAVQLETGNIATDFEPPPYELARLAAYKHLQMYEVYSISGSMWVPFLAPITDVKDIGDISVQLFDSTENIKIVGVANNKKVVTVTTDKDHGLNIDDIVKLNFLVSTTISATTASKLNIVALIEEVPNNTTFKYSVISNISDIFISGSTSIGTINYKSVATASNLTRYGFLMTHINSEKTNVTVIATKAGSDEVF